MPGLEVAPRLERNTNTGPQASEGRRDAKVLDRISTLSADLEDSMSFGCNTQHFLAVGTSSHPSAYR